MFRQSLLIIYRGFNIKTRLKELLTHIVFGKSQVIKLKNLSGPFFNMIFLYYFSMEIIEFSRDDFFYGSFGQ